MRDLRARMISICSTAKTRNYAGYSSAKAFTVFEERGGVSGRAEAISDREYMVLNTVHSVVLCYGLAMV